MKLIIALFFFMSFSAYAQMENCSWDGMPKVLSIRGSADSCGPVKLCVGRYRCAGGIVGNCSHLSRDGSCGTVAVECLPGGLVTYDTPRDADLPRQSPAAPGSTVTNE